MDVILKQFGNAKNKEPRESTTPAQPHQQTLLNQLETMVNQTVGSDVHFIVGPSKKLFYGHAFILTVRSIVWQQQLYNSVVPVLTTNSPSSTPIKQSKTKNQKVPPLQLYPSTPVENSSSSATFCNSSTKFVIELPSADANSFLEFLSYVYCAKCFSCFIF